MLYGVISNKIQKMQTRAAQILTFSNYEVCLSVFLDELGWERLENAPDPELSLPKGAYTAGEMFCGTDSLREYKPV